MTMKKKCNSEFIIKFSLFLSVFESNFLTTQCIGYVEGSTCAKKQLDSSNRFDRRRFVTDIHRQSQGSTALHTIASRG